MKVAELKEYYNKYKNAVDEIKLIDKRTGSNCTFRRYKEVYTGTIKWANLDSGLLYSTEHLIEFYDIRRYTKDVLQSMVLLTDVTLEDPHGNITLYRKIDDNAFVEIFNGNVKTTGFNFVYNLSDLLNYEVIE